MFLQIIEKLDVRQPRTTFGCPRQLLRQVMHQFGGGILRTKPAERISSGTVSHGQDSEFLAGFNRIRILPMGSVMGMFFAPSRGTHNMPPIGRPLLGAIVVLILVKLDRWELDLEIGGIPRTLRWFGFPNCLCQLQCWGYFWRGWRRRRHGEGFSVGDGFGSRGVFRCLRWCGCWGGAWSCYRFAHGSRSGFDCGYRRGSRAFWFAAHLGIFRDTGGFAIPPFANF